MDVIRTAREMFKEAARVTAGWGERGAALITALMFLVILTLLGLASIMTSSTEVLISRNDRINKVALDYANAGVQQVLTRLDLDTAEGWHLANYTTMARHANPSYSQNFSSADTPGLSPIDFTGTVTYRLEDALHNYTGYNDHSPRVAGYSQDCRYNKSPITSIDFAYPVYKITSTGKLVSDGTEMATATVVVEVSRNVLNLNVPGALYSASCIDVNGNVTIAGGTKPAYVTPCTSDTDTPAGDGIDLNGHTADITGGYQAGCADCFKDMTGVTTFLGTSLSEVKNMAVSQSHYYKSTDGGSTWLSPPTANGNPPGAWGGYVTSTNPAIVYIDVKGGEYQIPSNKDSFGMLVVDGDLRTSGNANWNGLIYTTGSFTAATGTFTCNGGIMSGGTINTDLSGTVNVNYNKTYLDKISRQSFSTKIINWQRMYNY